MVTSGMDKKLKVFDIRAFKSLKSYFIPAGASCLSLSQRGLLSAATGDIVQVSITFTPPTSTYKQCTTKEAEANGVFRYETDGYIFTEFIFFLYFFKIMQLFSG